MSVPFDPVIVFQQERFDHSGQFHIQIQDIYRECDDEESRADKKQDSKKLHNSFHSLSLPPAYHDSSSSRTSRDGSNGSSLMTVRMKELI